MHKLGDIREIRCCLIDWAKTNKENPDIPCYGQVIDMIKDCYEMEKDAYKGFYYEMAGLDICQQMGEVPNVRAGYDHWRTSSGRFAKKGTGHYSAGYDREYDIQMRSGRIDDRMPHEMRSDIWDNQRAGARPYMKTSTRMTGRYGYPMDEHHTKAYNDFDDARRHYHDSNDPNAKKEMDEHAAAHAKEVIMTSKDIYKEASPELRKKLKEDFTKMVNDFAATP